MGEVYKARDVRLNRVVALKLLPDTAAKDAERRERFEREAQAVAALNHPGIVTIHSVEEAGGRFFLTMELVEGQSLADAIPPAGMPLDRLLKVAIAVADAMAAAHQKGITHRDLKPANIMLGEGEHAGRVKVLDFGLAKLADAPAAAMGATTLPTAPITGEGRILGTVAYMSPEQAEGKPIDARSDLFSLGVILYEMATGRRPFTGDTNISIISSIVKDTPTSVTELNPALPREFGRIVRRALTKDPERRYQTAKDLRNDLEEFKASLDSGELHSATVASGSLPLVAVGAAPRSRGIAIMAAILVLALAGGVLYVLTRQGSQPDASATAPSVQDLQITQLTTSGIASRPVISPDGKYVAYIQQSGTSGAGGGPPYGGSVWIRQVATSSNVQIVASNPAMWVRGLTVTPDGNYVDYVGNIRGAEAPDLWRVSFLGGTPTKLVENVDTPIGWSPDGRQMAFVREDVVGGVWELLLAEADGGNPRVLTTRKYPATFNTAALASRPSARPAWSLDGRVIAVAGSVRAPVFQDQVVFVDSASGAEQQALPVQDTVLGLDWLDAGSLAVNQAVEEGGPSQLWRLAYRGGAVTRFTNDLGSYTDLSVIAARDSLVTTKTDRRVSVWVTDGSGANAKEIVPPTQSSGTLDHVAWAADRLLFTNTNGSRRTISSAGQDGGASMELIAQGSWPTTTSDGRTVVFRATGGERQGLWKVTDGGRPTLLSTASAGWPSVTFDDRAVVYASTTDGVQSLWMVSIDGGAPVRVTNRFVTSPILSPDGKSVAFGTRDDQDRSGYAICDLPDCSSPRSVPARPDGGRQRIDWTADGRGFLYVAGTPQNLWVESLNGKPPRQLTHFTDNRQIADVAWSRDGKRLAIARTTQTSDIVLFRGLKR